MKTNDIQLHAVWLLSVSDLRFDAHFYADIQVCSILNMRNGQHFAHKSLLSRTSRAGSGRMKYSIQPLTTKILRLSPWPYKNVSRIINKKVNKQTKMLIKNIQEIINIQINEQLYQPL